MGKLRMERLSSVKMKWRNLTNPKIGRLNQNGFTLPELLVAILILAIGIIGVMSLFPQGYTEISEAGRVSAMNHLGQQKLDELRVKGFNDPDLMAGTHPSSPERFTVTNSKGKNVYEEYTVTWEVFPDEPEANMKRVVVEVGHQLYDDSDNPLSPSQAINQKVVRFQTYFSR